MYQLKKEYYQNTISFMKKISNRPGLEVDDIRRLERLRKLLRSGRKIITQNIQRNVYYKIRFLVF